MIGNGGLPKVFSSTWPIRGSGHVGFRPTPIHDLGFSILPHVKDLMSNILLLVA